MLRSPYISPSPTSPPHLQRPQVYLLCLFLHCCPANKFIGTIFLDSIYMCCCCCCQVASVVSDSVRSQRRQPTRLPRPWGSPGKNTGVGCHFLLQCLKVKSESEVAQSCPTLRDPMGYSLPGSSIHGIFQACVRILNLSLDLKELLSFNYLSNKAHLQLF